MQENQAVHRVSQLLSIMATTETFRSLQQRLFGHIVLEKNAIDGSEMILH